MNYVLDSSLSKFKTDFSFGIEYVNVVSSYAVEYGLSSYDSAYLELAIRKKARIGTLDDNLLKACVRAGLQTI